MTDAPHDDDHSLGPDVEIQRLGASIEFARELWRLARVAPPAVKARLLQLPAEAQEPA